MGVEGGKLEEELANKARTTIGTKFSVLHCIRIPVENEMWLFDRLIHSYEYPCSSKRFPCDETVGLVLEVFHCQEKSNSLT